jgi:hypothetical protein
MGCAHALDAKALDMKYTVLGTDSKVNGSPTLSVSDRSTYLIQGWRMPGRIDQVEIPHGLLGFLRPDTCLGVKIRDTGWGTFLVEGRPLDDSEALARMAVPGHETVVEVPVGVQRRRD